MSVNCKHNEEYCIQFYTIVDSILSNDNLWLAYPSGILKNYNKKKSININKNKK